MPNDNDGCLLSIPSALVPWNRDLLFGDDIPVFDVIVGAHILPESLVLSRMSHIPVLCSLWYKCISPDIRGMCYVCNEYARHFPVMHMRL